MAKMRETTYYALTALLEGPAHGYGILEKVRAMTGGDVSLTTATLYATLDRLVDDGEIERAGSEIVNGRARQYFEITEKGTGSVQMEAGRLAAAAAAFESAMKARAARQRSPRPAPAPGLPAFRLPAAGWARP